MAKKKNLNKDKHQKQPMKHILRSGYGFIGGAIAIYGLILTINNIGSNLFVGILLIVAGLGLFFYGYKG